MKPKESPLAVTSGQGATRVILVGNVSGIGQKGPFLSICELISCWTDGVAWVVGGCISWRSQGVPRHPQALYVSNGGVSRRNRT